MVEKKPADKKEKKKKPVKKSRAKRRILEGKGFRYNRFVEVGRVILLTGPHYRGKTAAIVDIISEIWVLVDGPLTGVPRIPVYMDHLNLTGLKIDIPRAAKRDVVKKAWIDADIDRQWSKTGVCRALRRAKKMKSMNDFDHYKLKRIKSKRNNIVRTYFKKLKAHPKRLAGILQYRRAKKAGKVTRMDKTKLAEFRKKNKEEMKKRGLKRREKALARKSQPKPAKPEVAAK